MGHRFVMLFLAAAVVLGWASMAQAFQLQPMEAELEPSGAGSTVYFTVRNETNKQVPVQLAVFNRQMGTDGRDALTDASDQFRLLPTQVILQPKQSRRVRLQWVGGDVPDHERAFRLIAEQVPVELKKPDPQDQTGGRVKFLVKYVASIYVTRRGVAPKVAVESLSRVGELPQDHPVVHAEGNGQATAQGPFVKIVISNPGTAHGFVPTAGLRLTSLAADGSQTSVVLDPPSLKGLVGENVLAGGVRHFYMPWPAGLEPGELSAQWIEADADSKR